MLKHPQLTRKQLAFLAKRDLVGYKRAVQALEDLRVDGENPRFCFIGMYANPDEAPDDPQRTYAYSRIGDEIYKAFYPDNRKFIEYAVHGCQPGLPLNDEEQAFVVLCKQVYADVCSPQATGSEE